MKDYKGIHEQLNRRADSWQDGWGKRAETWMHGALWGVIAVITLLVFL